jgi:hypothetical protein
MKINKELIKEGIKDWLGKRKKDNDKYSLEQILFTVRNYVNYHYLRESAPVTCEAIIRKLGLDNIKNIYDTGKENKTIIEALAYEYHRAISGTHKGME